MSGRILLILGIVMIVLGLLWAAQGSGLLAWPASSPMISNGAWTWYGFGLALLGFGVLAYARRR